MKSLLICPDKRPAMASLTEQLPLAHFPVMGQSLVEYWLTHVACNGIKQVALVANDRPESVKNLVGDGARWGIEIEVIPELRELTPAEALNKYEGILQSGKESVTLMDHFPGLPEYPLFESQAGFFAGIRAWMPKSRTPDRIGVRELSLGVWVGQNARVSSAAIVQAPCWLGKNVLVGAHAIIGPGTILEDGSLIESKAEVVDSYIGPDTFVGQGIIVKDSIAFGSTLINWKTGSVAEVPDAFVLCSLKRPQHASGRKWLQRVTEICAPAKEENELFIKDLLINKETSP